MPQVFVGRCLLSEPEADAATSDQLKHQRLMQRTP